MRPLRPSESSSSRRPLATLISILLLATPAMAAGIPIDLPVSLPGEGDDDAGTVSAMSCGKTSAYTAIWEIQGSGHTSPLVGTDPGEVHGIVTANFQSGTGGPTAINGFFLQAHEPDCDAATSDGIFVYTGSSPKSIVVGNLVKLTGSSVTEYQGPASFVWDLTLTELLCTSCAVSTITAGYGLPAAEEITPPTDAAQAVTYYEAREGMLGQVAVDATVVAPTNAYNELTVVRGALQDRLHQEAANGGLAIMVDGDGVATAQCGVNGLPPARTFDAVPYLPATGKGIYGPITYNFNAYKVQQDDNTRCIQVNAGNYASYDPTTNPAPSRTSDTLTVGDLNVENFFDTTNDPAKSDPVPTSTEYNTKSLKIARAVCNAEGLNQPHVVALQEVENQNVLNKLKADIATVCGATYDVHTAGAPDNRGIEVSYLTRADSVTVTSVTPRQGCSAVNHAVTYESGDAAPGVTCTGGTPYYLHNRPPLEMVAKVTLAGAERTIHLYNNHFKSKLASGSCSQPDCTDWRVEEAQHVRALANALPQGSHAIVLGDLNDYYVSAPLAEIVHPTGPLNNLWDDHPTSGAGQGAVKRYSYIYNGVSQVLDHVLVSDSLNALQRSVSPRHFDADWPASYAADSSVPYRASDHDGQVAAFTFTPAAPTPPAAPTLSATAGDARVDLSWTTPLDGGSPITGYNVYRNGTLYQTLGVQTTYADTAVTNGVTYAYRVSATNAVGEGAQSNELNVTPSGAPPTPTIRINEVEHNPAGTDAGFEYVELHNYGTQTIDLTGWNVTANGGSPVTITLSGTLAPGAFKVVTRASQFLDNSGEWVTLKDAAGTTRDTTPTQNDSANNANSWQRVSANPSTWQFVTSTKGTANP